LLKKTRKMPRLLFKEGQQQGQQQQERQQRQLVLPNR